MYQHQKILAITYKFAMLSDSNRPQYKMQRASFTVEVGWAKFLHRLII